MNGSEGNSDRGCGFRFYLQTVIEFVSSEVSGLYYINGCFRRLIKLILIQNYYHEVKKTSGLIEISMG